MIKGHPRAKLYVEKIINSFNYSLPYDEIKEATSID